MLYIRPEREVDRAREINRLIGVKVMNWCVFDEDSPYFAHYRTADGGFVPHQRNPSKRLLLSDWNPWGDIGDAMRAVDRVNATLGWDVGIETVQSWTYLRGTGKQGQDRWLCTVRKPVGDESGVVAYKAGAKALTHAICKAVLQIWGINV